MASFFSNMPFINPCQDSRGELVQIFPKDFYHHKPLKNLVLSTRVRDPAITPERNAKAWLDEGHRKAMDVLLENWAFKGGLMNPISDKWGDGISRI